MVKFLNNLTKDRKLLIEKEVLVNYDWNYDLYNIWNINFYFFY